ncbi:SANT/Myb-like DNA-binding domain-containing protein, partial [Aspergillus homomorphus CBS 101889]
MTRRRRSWTAKEDELLRTLVQKDLDTFGRVMWSELAQKVRGRTNKDCRRRWWNTLAEWNIKGVWSPDENKRLVEAVRMYGSKWTQVAAVVGTRCGDQCSSHWREVLRPNVNYCSWTEEEIGRLSFQACHPRTIVDSRTAQDEELLQAIQICGTNWSTIAAFHLPHRTGLGLKNRYARIRAKARANT